jgi:hypothetical protein
MSQEGPREKAALAALELAADRRWSDITLSDVATASGLSLSDLYPMTGAETLIPEIERHFDRAMSAEGVEAGELDREKLFDVIMLRFEAMEARRAGTVAMLSHIEASPVRRASALYRRRDTARWALVSAGLEASDDPLLGPLIGQAAEVSLAWTIWQAEKAWMEDTDKDFARTMAKLDKGLREWESRLDRLKNPFGIGKRREPPSDHTSGAEPADLT